MKWQFINRTTLEELESGYVILLIKGTWFHPDKLKPVAPPGMDFAEQIKLLRKGIAHIKSIGQERQTEKETA